MGLHQVLKNTKLYWVLRELYVLVKIFFSRLLGIFAVKAKTRRRLLFYHIVGLGYGGTETFLQILAKYANKEKYDVYFMYSDKNVPGAGVEDFTSRLSLLIEGNVFPIRFDYSAVGNSMPYIVKGMSPDIFNIIDDYKIDLLVTAGAGHADYPFSAIKNIPIIFINVFGQPNMQKNIVAHLCISQEVADKLIPFVPKDKIKVVYVPSEEPTAKSSSQGLELRRSLGIPDGDLVFGRIGRNSNNIFDPIGINAFKKVVSKHKNVHYLIVSPAPILEKIVSEEKIPNIHFVKGSGKMEDLWSFYFAFDILAHFRHDGESFGLNIAQAMLCGRPVISHKSKFWNAHLEYLTKDFSRVAEIDNVEEYVDHMEWFISEWQNGNLSKYGDLAKNKAVGLVSIKRHMADFEFYVDRAFRKIK